MNKVVETSFVKRAYESHSELPIKIIFLERVFNSGNEVTDDRICFEYEEDVFWLSSQFIKNYSIKHISWRAKKEIEYFKKIALQEYENLEFGDSRLNYMISVLKIREEQQEWGEYWNYKGIRKVLYTYIENLISDNEKRVELENEEGKVVFKKVYKKVMDDFIKTHEADDIEYS